MSESTPVRPVRNASRRRRHRATRRRNSELREFLAAGKAEEAEPQASPEFKERLRDELWDLLQSRLQHDTK